ncbi:nitrite reductase small subunit NirD [Motiliproteus sp. MSK22-1]|uniref:nitrite reductase small subunit NirD n=1 Tax=Motiliproteus sp. MSK22-1 TaxID=1897630 RepID=UPI000977CC5E|nr:nitrite reductase small subunit NirD [Motiliproteus sp. MSK22-1]OMH39134.1 nitrite reductase small subunit [Motiliproteus sp. MSK22-1]
MNWTPVCALEDIAPNTGVCALVEGKQVAIFRIDKEERLYAIGNYDPAGKANVLSRGLIAQLGGSVNVTSPLYKHHYDLDSGVCQEDQTLKVPTYNVRQHGGMVEVAA